MGFFDNWSLSGNTSSDEDAGNAVADAAAEAKAKKNREDAAAAAEEKARKSREQALAIALIIKEQEAANRKAVQEAANNKAVQEAANNKAVQEAANNKVQIQGQNKTTAMLGSASPQQTGMQQNIPPTSYMSSSGFTSSQIGGQSPQQTMETAPLVNQKSGGTQRPLNRYFSPQISGLAFGGS
jgi:membrane protein involved in colicin uptake